MKNHAPYTPFSTRLSRSAKEAEIRLRNISSGPKKRPPILLLILMACVCVFCGNLVSCQMAEAEVSPDSSTSASTSSNASIPEQPPEAWTPVELDTGLLQYNETTLDKPYEFLTEAEITLLQDLPAEELPKEAVELSSALRQDYWKDILLPTAYTEEIGRAHV